MSNNQDWYDDDDFDFEDEGVEQEQVQNNREVLKKVRRAERAKDKELKAVKAELEELRKFQREANVTKVLQEKGINPKVAAFIPQDIEVSAESITSWVEQYADLFGGAVSQEEVSETKVSQNDLEALRQINAATSGAVSPEGTADISSAIENAESAEAIYKLLNG